jgi:hypothetical protein
MTTRLSDCTIVLRVDDSTRLASKACTVAQDRSVGLTIGGKRARYSHNLNVALEVVQGSKAAVWNFFVTREQGASCCVGAGVEVERQG